MTLEGQESGNDFALVRAVNPEIIFIRRDLECPFDATDS
jgi:hypothetical protein